jgi:hypothetical protein
VNALAAISDQSTITHPWAVAALIALGLLVWAVVAVRRAGRKIDAALPTLLDGPPCAVLTCHDAGTEWVYDRLLCEGHAERILNRAPYDQARDALDDVLDGRAK